MKTQPASRVAATQEARAPGLLALAILGFLAAPTGWIVVGFQAAVDGAVPVWGWVLALVGLPASGAAIKLASRERARSSATSQIAPGWTTPVTGLGVASLVLAALGPAFWILVQIAPSEPSLEGSLLGPAGFLIAILVGMISFFSPCILPLLPGYLSFVSGLSGEEMERGVARRKVILGTTLFTLGFATVFTGLGASASLAGSFLTDNLPTINRIAGVIVIVMGLAFMAPQTMRFLEVERRPLMNRVKPGVGGAFPLGLAFAVGWTPCVGPGLGIMLTLGAAEGRVASGALLLFFFSIGFGVWFVLAALGMRHALGASAWLRKHTRTLQAVGGAFLLVLGVLLVTDLWNELINPLRRLIQNFIPPV